MRLSSRTIILFFVFLLISSLTAYFFFSQGSSPSTYELTSTDSSSTLISRLQSFLSPQSTNTSQSLTPTKTPIPLTPGKGTYNISHSDTGGPKISQVIFDPLDAKRGNQLTLTIKVPLTRPADLVFAAFQSDNNIMDLDFTLSNTDDSYQFWTTSIQLQDSVFYQYILSITATYNGKSTQATVAPRS